MKNDHNQVVAISIIVCRYCVGMRRTFGAKPYRELFPTPQKLERTYQFIYALGGRKRFTEPKSSACLRAHLYTPEFFQACASNIELMGRFQGGIVRYWNGLGTSKDMCIEDFAKQLEWMDFGEPSNFMEYQVDITNIWSEISPYLEL